MVRMLHAHRCILDFEDTPMSSTNVQGVHLLNDQLSVSQRIIVRSNGKERCTTVLVITLPTLRTSVRVCHRRTDIDATHCQFDRRLVVIMNVFISCFGYNILLLSNDKCVVLLTRLIVSSPSRETRLRFISAFLYRLTLLLFPPRINSPLYTRMVRRNVIGSQPDAMNVTEVIILLTFVISSDGIRDDRAPSVPEEVFETLVAGSTWMGCGTVPWR
ncbi:hypothetical protein G5I_07031 [Acromyrmex echinatior]|uniref:Uncharacterized protein n=1 Tax=Acromyrmex echinatior TaxID=103372 RepID=F4WMP7_ACREC|nr:hypothetical protein G5I_07031 [Acromyrmex echinatior]